MPGEYACFCSSLTAFVADDFDVLHTAIRRECCLQHLGLPRATRQPSDPARTSREAGDAGASSHLGGLAANYEQAGLWWVVHEVSRGQGGG